MLLTFLKSLHLVYSLSVSFYPVEQQGFIGSDYNLETFFSHTKKNFIATNLEVRVLTPKEYFYIGGKTINHAGNLKNGAFRPYENQYTFSIGAKFNFLETGYEHECTHPVASMSKRGLALDSRYGSYDRFYVKISNR